MTGAGEARWIDGSGGPKRDRVGGIASTRCRALTVRSSDETVKPSSIKTTFSTSLVGLRKLPALAAMCTACGVENVCAGSVNRKLVE